tara:strand:- start:18 stop:524 length:507 start_codon:yes stop_codon:yes gene_type:complete
MEIWKDVKNYEGRYQISNFGNVKSLERIVKHSRGGDKVVREKILQPGTDGGGYPQVTLHNSGRVTIKVHRLVAESFLGHEPNGTHEIVVDHIDNNPLNNNINNLQLISQRENLSKDKKGTSKHTGVHWYKRDKKWVSSIRINGKLKHLGRFNCETKAHLAYQNKLKTL